MAKTLEEKIYRELVIIRQLIEDELKRQKRERNDKQMRDFMIMETQRINGGKQNGYSFDTGRIVDERDLLRRDVPTGEEKER